MGKKQTLLKAAIPLFARKGFDATTTLEIATSAGVTEPVIYYNFRNKSDLFATILRQTFDEYFRRLERIDVRNDCQYRQIEQLIDLHFKFLEDFPDETNIIMSACPDRLRESGHICTRLVADQRKRLSAFIGECLTKGIATGEFHTVDVVAVTGLIIAMLNGIMRRRALHLDELEDMREETVTFCKRGLVKNA